MEDNTRLNVDKLRQEKKTQFISTEESLKDIEPFFGSLEDLLLFIENASIEDVTNLLKFYGVKFESDGE